ncbi:MAG: PcfK-like family protein [Muribaculaceae bacterium]|nr:PcfK-like family protein [Muribaculaceae bacterium]
MATMMKSNDGALALIQMMLQERCIAEPSFAIKMANPSKSIEGAVNYLCSQIQKSGLCMVDNTKVMNILVHYFDENEIEDCGKVNCKIVVSKPELSEEDKQMLKEQAMEEYKEEQLKQIRRDNAPKATPKPKPTTTAPKAGAEINVQPSLFDF